MRDDDNGTLSLLNDWMDDIKDPEWGPVGSILKQCLHVMGCTEYIIPAPPARRKNPSFPLAVYSAFNYPPDCPDPSFANALGYSAQAAGNPLKLLISRLHELFHALQWNNAPALHMSPFNAASPVMTCPAHFLLTVLATEKDAYAKQAWLSSLAVAQHPKLTTLTAADPVSATEFSFLRAALPSLAEALAEAASKAMTKKHSKDNVAPVVSFDDYYQGYALADYERMMDYRLKHPGAAPRQTLVRLEPDDIHAMGWSFGPNIFGADAASPALVRLPPLSPKNQTTLDRLDKKYGTGAIENLQTFRTGLAAHGLTPESFLTCSKTYRSVPAATPVPPAPRGP